MHFKQLLVMSLLCVATILVHQSKALCGSCQPNGIACINETSFNMCFENIPRTTEVYHCDQNEVCTNKVVKCLPKDATSPACEVSKNCGVCDGSKMFVCISRNKFAQCNSFTRTEITGSCPDGMYCRSSGGEICVSDCLASRDGVECDRDEEVFN